MPYKSEAQRRYFNVNRKKLEAQGVDVDEWNQASKGKKLPEKKANTPGQTGNIPVTPPTPVRPEAAPSGNIPRPARRQTTLADGRGVEAMAAKEAATPFFYLLGDSSKMSAHVKTANLPKQTVNKYPQSDRRKGPYPFKGGPGRLGLGQFPEPEPAPAPSYFDSARNFGSKLIPSFSQLKDFATSPLGIGTGLGLGGLGALAYMNSRPRRDEDEEKEAGVKLMAKIAARSSVKWGSEAEDKKEKKDEKEQTPERTHLGPLEHAYVADYMGGHSTQNTARKLKQMYQDPDNPYQSLYDHLALYGSGAMEDYGERISRGSARLAESQPWRMLAAIDPTAQDNQEGVIGLLAGFGGHHKDIESASRRTADAYRKFLKKYQEKFDPKAELTTRETPFHIGAQGELANLDTDIAGHSYLRNEQPLHYWLNPFSKAGPLTEIMDRGLRRITAAEAQPDSTLGRFGMGLGGVATLGALPLFMGGEAAQQKLRASAVKNKLYAPEAMPEEKVASNSVKYIAKIAARAVVKQAELNAELPSFRWCR